MMTTTTDRTDLTYKYVPADLFEDYEFSTDPANLYDEDEPGYVDLRTGIGDVLLAFGELEHALEQTIAILLEKSGSHTGFVITGLMTYNAKVTLFNEIAHGKIAISEPQLKGPLKALHNELEICGTIRNIVAHAKWSSTTQDGFVRYDTKTDKETGELKIRYYHFDEDAFHQICIRMANAEDALSDFSDLAHIL